MMGNSNFQFLKSKEVIFSKEPGKTNTNLLKRNMAEDRPGRLREGTPFVILGEEKGFLKILVIDIYYDLQDYSQRIGYIKNNVVYSSQISTADIPYFDSRSLFRSD